ncbi:MAG TPA: STAS domain-containing protein [Bacillales bacterium]|nr:STAS domain-containing protein [Bacillales bacterium]
MEDTVIQIIKDRREEIISSWMDEMEKARGEHRLQHITDEAFRSSNRQFIEMIWENLEDRNEPSVDLSERFIGRLLEIGLPLSYLTRGLQTFRNLVLDLCFEQMEHSESIHKFYTDIDRWYDPIINRLVSTSVKTWEDTVSSQRTALKELSAPLIPVFEGISVMPLIGAIDTERAKLIMENLLDGVIEHSAQVVLIDITGVPIVDTMVAHHIIQAAEAVRLIGAKCILVGIRPEIAQTIITLGIDLSDFLTKSTLKKGMQTALEITDREIVELTEGGSR